MRFALLLFTAVVAVACASPAAVQVRTDPATGLHTYESSRTTMGHRSLNAGLAANQRVMWQAVAACDGANCVPDQVALVFFNNTGRDLNLDYRRFEMIVDGTSQEWYDSSRDAEPNYFTVPPGEFLRVTLDQADFMRFVEAEQVELRFGESGTSVFTVGPDRRAIFREFAETAGLTT
ncbi:MAG: hypothetical protein RhofKO_36980 [Rhodothermales bacterium]